MREEVPRMPKLGRVLVYMIVLILILFAVGEREEGKTLQEIQGPFDNISMMDNVSISYVRLNSTNHTMKQAVNNIVYKGFDLLIEVYYILIYTVTDFAYRYMSFETAKKILDYSGIILLAVVIKILFRPLVIIFIAIYLLIQKLRGVDYESGIRIRDSKTQRRVRSIRSQKERTESRDPNNGKAL